MKKAKSIIPLVMSVLMLLTHGCQKADGESAGRLIVNITDAPFPIDVIEEATVTLIKVEIRDEGEGEENPFLTIFEGSKQFNLLELRNGVMEVLVDVEIPAGNYNLIRVHVEEAGIVVVDQTNYSVKVPSGSQSGIKMFITPSLQVQGGLTSEVILDFNLDKSFVLKGNINTPAGIKGFNFKPVIRAVNRTFAGSISGKVYNSDGAPLSGAIVSVMLDELVITQSEEDGSYTLSGLPAGLYSVNVEKEGYTSLTVDELEVVAGNNTLQDFILEPVPDE